MRCSRFKIKHNRDLGYKWKLQIIEVQSFPFGIDLKEKGAIAQNKSKYQTPTIIIFFFILLLMKYLVAQLSQAHHRTNTYNKVNINSIGINSVLIKHKKSCLVQKQRSNKSKNIHKGFQIKQKVFNNKPYISWEVNPITKKNFCHNQCIPQMSHHQLTNIVQSLKNDDINKPNKFKEQIKAVDYLAIPDTIQQRDRVNWVRQELVVILAVNLLTRMSMSISQDEISWFLIKKGVKQYRQIRDQFIMDNGAPSICFVALYTEKLLYLNKHHYKFIKIAKKLGLQKFGVNINYQKPIYPQLCLRIYNSCCRYYNIAPDYLSNDNKTGLTTHLSINTHHLVYIQINGAGKPTIIDLSSQQCYIKPKFGENINYLTLLENIYQEQELVKINKKQHISDNQYWLTPITIAYNSQLNRLQLTDTQPIYIEI